MQLVTKTRALVALAVVLLFAAVNRADPVLYAMAATLAAMAGLGYGMPWLALRTVALQPAGAWREEIEVAEGEPLDIALHLRQVGWCPAWMVEVQAEWTWAGRRFFTRDTIAFVAPRSSVTAFGAMRFGCRGHYRLAALRVRSGFPLGLVEAECDSPVPPLSVRVLPAVAAVHLPAEWTVSDDAAGDRALAHAGESLDLNMLRAYEPGEALRRVDWRASARAGELIVRQFQHPASMVVKVVVELPQARDVGRPDAPAEHAVRVCAGVCRLLAREAVRTLLLLPGQRAFEADDAMPVALAGALFGTSSWNDYLMQAADTLHRGEQLLAVVGANADATTLIAASFRARAASGRLVVVIATSPPLGADLAASAMRLSELLRSAGAQAWPAWQ
jgi:uncharacterized protein (DUF58 family)